jgi:proline dehydrogenase
MFKSLILFLSRNKLAEKVFREWRVFKKISRRFVAGETLEDALEVAKKLNSEGIKVILDYLGEHYTNKEEVLRALESYKEIIKRIFAEKIDSWISVKLTQLGIDIDEEFCFENTREIVRYAEKFGIVVQIDMESYPYVDKTLRIFKKVRKEYRNVGLCIQAHLYRTESDLKSLLPLKPNLRLVKGAYKESKKFAFQKKKDVDRNYMKIMGLMFQNIRDVYPCIATHDLKMIHAAKKLCKDKDRFEFQMLYGIKRRLQRSLAKEGYNVRVYLPFGTLWYPYLMRRIAERPANLWFVVKNLWD